MKHDEAVIRSPLFWGLSYLAVMVICWPLYLQIIKSAGSSTIIYGTVIYITYGVIYLLPSFILSRLAAWLGQKIPFVVRCVAVVTVGVTLLFLFSDAAIYKIYGDHINGFVLNIIMTPGGIESLGASTETVVYFGLIAAGLVMLPGIFYYAAAWASKGREGSSPFRWGLIFMLFILLTSGERLASGIGQICGWDGFYMAGEPLPAFHPTSFRRLARKFGIKVAPRGLASVKTKGRISYPLTPVQYEIPEKPLNIVWLVAESWRWDMLNPEIMPATWKFADESQRFVNHYSGGNGTRMGLFSMFYSLYGSSWFNFINAKHGPVIMETFKKEGYQWNFFTSASFSYPEFDRTIFYDVDRADLHDDNTEGTKWGNDRRNVGRMLDFIEHRDKSRPFMTFMFFESPHARYYFPPENIIRKPYLEELNYATMDLNRDISLIYNRYVNATNHLDSQFDRVFAYLKENDLLRNTIVIVTGDHGEEFMEKGRWGHNSEFHEEQIHVPMILSVPGMRPAVYSKMTSHIDIVPTIAPYLGVKSNLSDYSLGLPLFGEEEHDFITAAGWGSLAVIDRQYKVRIPMKSSDMMKGKTTHFDDTPLASGEDYISETSDKIARVISNQRRFLKREL